MHRRSLGNGRRLAILGALLILVACLLPWYTLGGEGGLPELTLRAFDGSGILCFLAAIITLALVTLPYAAGDRPVNLDRGLFYWILALVSVAGLILWIPGILGAPEGLFPTGAAGYWLAVVGTIVLARAAFEIGTEAPRR